METSNSYITFIVISSSIAVAFVIFIAIDLVLLFRMRQAKSRAKIAELEGRIVKEVNDAKAEATTEVMRNIGQELHDNIAQNITFSMMQVKRIAGDDSGLLQTAELLKDTMQEVRQLSHILAGDLDDQLNLKNALQRLGQNLKRSGNIELNMDVIELPVSFGKSNEMLLMRIVQELSNNTLKHANATKVNIQIDADHDGIDVHYSDNGKGFDEKSTSMNGIGMASIKRRLDLMKANWTLHSSPGKGFEFECKIPLQK